MKVSIAMCSYNVSRFIDRAIQSILAQTYEDWELIISDDASTDNTVALIEPYLVDKRIKLIRQPQNLGYVRNKNFVLQAVTGTLITQLDSDDACHPQRLEKQVAAFRNNSSLKACSIGFDLIDEEDNVVSHATPGENSFITELMLDYPFSLVGIMIRAEVWQEMGYYDEFFAGSVGEDHYLVWRVNAKYPIYFINEPLIKYRINHTSVTHTFDNPRKLIGGLTLAELCRQIKSTGTDWLQQGKLEEAAAYEKQLLRNRRLMAERYRIWAAKAVDKENFPEALALIKKAFNANAFHRDTYTTLSYFLRRRFLYSRKNTVQS